MLCCMITLIAIFAIYDLASLMHSEFSYLINYSDIVDSMTSIITTCLSAVFVGLGYWYFPSKSKQNNKQ